ncbi:MAG: hypothetical protein ACLT0Y_03625 [Christensenellales bacterium]
MAECGNKTVAGGAGIAGLQGLTIAQSCKHFTFPMRQRKELENS